MKRHDKPNDAASQPERLMIGRIASRLHAAPYYWTFRTIAPIFGYVDPNSISLLVRLVRFGMRA